LSSLLYIQKQCKLRQRLVMRQCCGSYSEIIRIFWLDPNPKKVRIWIRIQTLPVVKKFFCEKSQIKHLKEKKRTFFSEKLFSLSYRFQSTYERNERHHLKNSGQNISVRIRIRKKKIVDPNPKKMNLDPQHCYEVNINSLENNANIEM
jgi:hypothetical protein